MDIIKRSNDHIMMQTDHKVSQEQHKACLRTNNCASLTIKAKVTTMSELPFKCGHNGSRRRGRNAGPARVPHFLFPVRLLPLVAALAAVAVAYFQPCSATTPPSSRKALLLKTLRQAEIDPEVISKRDSQLGQALQTDVLEDPNAPIDLLSICRLQYRLEDDKEETQNLQGQCTVEMFDLTQETGIAPPNVTLAFGSDPYAKNQDFIAWCHRLLTSSYFLDNDVHLEDFRQNMVTQNPYWKAAVKATYLTIQGKKRKATTRDTPSFEDIIHDPGLWSEAIHSLGEE